MSKIKRAFTVEQETPKLRLLQSINRGQVSEAGVVDSIKSGVAKAADKVSNWAKNGQQTKPAQQTSTPEAKEEKDDVDSYQTGTTSTRDLTSIVTQIMQPGSGSKRFILSMTHPDLKKFYLKSGGGGDTAEMILLNSSDKDNAFASLAKNIKTNKMGRMVMIDSARPSLAKSFEAAPKLNMMVLLTVPEAAAKEFMMAPDDASAKEAFVKLMSHKFYTGTINRTKMTAQKAAELDNISENDEELVKAFDPHWLEHWRDNAMRVRAINEWDNVNSEDAQDAAKQKQSDRLSDEGARAEQDRKSRAQIEGGDDKNDTRIRNIISTSKDLDSVVSSLEGGIGRSEFTREDVVRVVKQMDKVLQSDVLKTLISKLGEEPASSDEPAATSVKK